MERITELSVPFKEIKEQLGELDACSSHFTNGWQVNMILRREGSIMHEAPMTGTTSYRTTRLHRTV
ncbi:hypothetical protein GC093_10845 [Paenibacillus sp. LMG 31456]|uniref:Uncharacterized protein n=1 Tax=Paenibacillus foliorum TaxID=2654974 RepID=A0A972K0D3_9BACL|nr:hypothetical protein [Paenibacillus foliorum]NOU93715.1 hypothetical protein [Paenibacillus foliorum]